VKEASVIKLVLGVLLWSITHLVPAVAADFRKQLQNRIGEIPYKGISTLLLLLSLYLIVSGWKSTVPELVYLPPAWGRHATALLVLAGFILFLAPYPPNNLKRLLRHPQLIGTVCWGVGHLLANGEGRSIVLFGGLTVWALAEIMLINRRDGAWTRPETAPRRNDVILVAAGFAAYLAFAFAHRWLFGVTPFIA
jgi:uncharacterized membrane protein